MKEFSPNEEQSSVLKEIKSALVARDRTLSEIIKENSADAWANNRVIFETVKELVTRAQDLGIPKVEIVSLEIKTNTHDEVIEILRVFEAIWELNQEEVELLKKRHNL